MPLIIILVDCGIEIIPKEIRNHSAVRKSYSSHIYSSQLLDNALHHTAMKELTNNLKRGRPDISHLCLLNALGSPLNKAGKMKIFIHTVNSKIYELSSEIRIARNYNRFKGLMAKLLIDDIINFNEKSLISRFEGDIRALVNNFSDPEIYLFSSKGELVRDYKNLFTNDISKNVLCIIGGFQKSNYSEEVSKLSKKLISLSNYSLDAWVVISKIINFYELYHNII